MNKGTWLFWICLIVITGGAVFGWSRMGWQSGANRLQPENAVNPAANTNATGYIGPTPQETPQVVDAGTIHGVIEGFYGNPWTNEQRRSMFVFMADHHLNTYAYAPKDDVYQRADWGSPYPAAEADHMNTLVQSAGARGIRFVYSISPGIPQPLPGQTLTPSMISHSMTFTSDTDVQRLETKIDQLRGFGVHTFLLSFDDVEKMLQQADAKVYGNDYAKAQVDLANRLLRDETRLDPDFRLWFAPVTYYGTHDNHNWFVIRTRLSRNIPVIWTGSWVLNANISAADAEEAARWLGRKPLLWDNYPVNDYTYVVNKAPALLMGPLQHRDPHLEEHLSGYIANPMLQPEASQVPLATVAEYLSDPAAYNPERAWVQAVQDLAGIHDDEAFLHFCRYASRSRLNPSGDSPFAAWAGQYWNAATPSLRKQVETKLRQELHGVESLSDRLQASVTNKELLTEIDPWSQKLSAEGQLGMATLDYLDLPVGSPQRASQRPLLNARLHAIRNNPLSIGPEVTDFIARALS